MSVKAISASKPIAGLIHSIQKIIPAIKKASGGVPVIGSPISSESLKAHKGKRGRIRQAVFELQGPSVVKGVDRENMQ